MQLSIQRTALTVLLLLAALTADALPASGPALSAPRPQVSGARSAPPALLAVGDIACDPSSPYFGAPRLCQQDHVGRRVRAQIRQGDDWFVPLGDIQYETGTYADFNQVYDKAFGDVRSVTKPVPGNHEYVTDQARGYFRYFRQRAGTPNIPWRTFIPAPGWRVLLLDSNCEHVGGCGPRSDQGNWIEDTLAGAAQPCVIAAWHHPLQTSGEYAGSEDSEGRARKLWRLVDAGGADIVLNGHDHIYERFAKKGGMQEFLVGTGGKNHYDITARADGSRKRIGNRYGVLRLALRPNGSYRHAFVTANGDVMDRGENTCNNEPAR